MFYLLYVKQCRYFIAYIGYSGGDAGLIMAPAHAAGITIETMPSFVDSYSVYGSRVNSPSLLLIKSSCCHP